MGNQQLQVQERQRQLQRRLEMETSLAESQMIAGELILLIELKEHMEKLKVAESTISDLMTLCDQKENQLEDSKLEFDRQTQQRQQDIDQQKQQIISINRQCEAKSVEYEQEIAKLKNENQLLSQELDNWKKNYEDLEDQYRRTQIFQLDEQISGIVQIQGKSEISEQSESQSFVINNHNRSAQNAMNIIRFAEHNCEVHRKPIEYLCIDEQCHHKCRRMCGRCVKRGESNVAHIDNILDCLANYQQNEESTKQDKATQVKQQFTYFYNQIIHQIQCIFQCIDIILQSVPRNQLVEQLINELLSQDIISTDGIEELAERIGGAIDLNSEDQYQVKDIHIIKIEDRQQYKVCLKLLGQHNQLMEYFNGLGLKLQQSYPKLNAILQAH